MRFSNSLSIFLSATLAGCALAPAQEQSIRVATEPPGAEVFVLDTSLGHTPVDIPVARIFPPTYPAAKEARYGRIVLKKPGCQEKIVTVGSRILERGEMAEKLDCSDTAKEGIAERLRELDTLRERGLIDEDEYRRQRQRILDSL